MKNCEEIISLIFPMFEQKKESRFCEFFTNNKCYEAKEEKRYELMGTEKVKKIKIVINHQVKSFKELFKYCGCINSIFFKQFYRINITDMSEMFYGCSLLNELNLSNFNTDKVTDMCRMFSRCSSLEELNLYNFNANNVKIISMLFYGCTSLKELICSDESIKNQFNNDLIF